MSAENRLSRFPAPGTAAKVSAIQFWVVYLVECAHHVAREIVYPYRKQGVHLIGFSGCYPNRYAFDMMARLCTHPNTGGRTSRLAWLRKLRPPRLDAARQGKRPGLSKRWSSRKEEARSPPSIKARPGWRRR